MKQYGRAIQWIAVLLAMGGCAEDVRIVEGPYVLPEAADRVVVIWETELPGDSWVEYGFTTGYGVRIGSDAGDRDHAANRLICLFKALHEVSIMAHHAVRQTTPARHEKGPPPRVGNTEVRHSIEGRK